MVDECSIGITAVGISVNEQPEKFVVAAVSKQSKSGLGMIRKERKLGKNKCN